jgi:hypothetical protein
MAVVCQEENLSCLSDLGGGSVRGPVLLVRVKLLQAFEDHEEAPSARYCHVRVERLPRCGIDPAETE